MRIEGTLVEIGDLEGYATPRPGIRLQRGGEIIEISGLRREELSTLAPGLIYRNVVLTLAAVVAPLRGRHLQPGDMAVTDISGGAFTRVRIVERDDSGQRRSQSGVMFRVSPPIAGGSSETWYDADWFEPAPPAEVPPSTLQLFGDAK